MIEHVDHVNIVVTNLPKSEKFYCGLLGLHAFRRARLEGEWIDAVVGLSGVQAEVVYLGFPGGGPRLELIQYHAPEGKSLEACGMANTAGLRHIALRVNDIDALHARLRAAGVHFFAPPVKVPAGVVHHEAGEKRLCYLHDPDGVILELAEYD